MIERVLPASGPLSGQGGASESSGVLSLDPPRGRPVGGGGTPRSLGVWGHQPPSSNADFGICKIRIFRIFSKKFRFRPGNSGKMPGVTPTSKKIDNPPPPYRSLNRKIGRTDQFQNRSGRPLLFHLRDLCFL